MLAQNFECSIDPSSFPTGIVTWLKGAASVTFPKKIIAKIQFNAKPPKQIIQSVIAVFIKLTLLKYKEPSIIEPESARNNGYTFLATAPSNGNIKTELYWILYSGLVESKLL